MKARLTSRIVIDALFRKARAAGGFGMVLAHGDDNAGAILLVCSERGQEMALLERITDLKGDYLWARCGPDDAANRGAYVERRRARDPDLWLIELDIPDAERFAAETT